MYFQSTTYVEVQVCRAFSKEQNLIVPEFWRITRPLGPVLKHEQACPVWDSGFECKAFYLVSQLPTESIAQTWQAMIALRGKEAA